MLAEAVTDANFSAQILWIAGRFSTPDLGGIAADRARLSSDYKVPESFTVCDASRLTLTLA